MNCHISEKGLLAKNYMFTILLVPFKGSFINDVIISWRVSVLSQHHKSLTILIRKIAKEGKGFKMLCHLHMTLEKRKTSYSKKSLTFHMIT